MAEIGRLTVVTSVKRLCLLLVLSINFAVVASPAVSADVQNPSSGAVGIQGKISTSPPKTGASIYSPTNGQSISTQTVTVSGICPKGLLVKVFNNDVLAGSVTCDSGSYSVQISLFGGQNTLVARVYDALDQAGPDSNIVSVTLSDASFNPLGLPLMTLTSAYARRGADPGQKLIWPITIAGGTSPFAVSVDWGDGKKLDLISQTLQGTFDISHTYQNAGIYNVSISVTDKNGLSAFLQLVGVANGSASANTTTGKTTIEVTKVLWIPAVLILAALPVAFWLGRRYELAALRKHLTR